MEEQNNQGNKIDLNNPYLKTSGRALLQMYNELYAKKQMVDWQFYYAGQEMQRRLNIIQQNGIYALPEDLVPPVFNGAEQQMQVQATANPAPQNVNDSIANGDNEKKIIIKESEVLAEEKSETKKEYAGKHILLSESYTPQQKKADEVIKKYLKP